jgi:Lrp/AsnC family leucine-responsive transcriptional regulator
LASSINGARRLDQIDVAILAELQREGRISNVTLAQRVGLSPTPCMERVRRLERQGYISGYSARLNPRLLGASLLVFVEVAMERTTLDVFEHFDQAVKKLTEVQECHMVAGGFDYLLKVRVADIDSYRTFLGNVLALLPGVRETHTYVVMEEVKSSTDIRLPTVEEEEEA